MKSADRDRGNRDTRRGGGAFGRDDGYRSQEQRNPEQQRYASREELVSHGSYGSGGRRFEDVGSMRHADDDRYNDPDARYGNRQHGERDYGRQPQGYDYQDRGFAARAGDEVRSWFGDDDAERRRDMDARYDERATGGRDDRHRDSDYHNWRSTQIAALDRDYDEYRQENRSKFHNEFGAWREKRQGQRGLLGSVEDMPRCSARMGRISAPSTRWVVTASC